MKRVTRRCFVAGMSAAALLPPVALRAVARGCPAPGYGFFDVAEARFIEPACERLIACDEDGAGALGTQVAHYLDRQLSSSWGAGQQSYRTGPWQPGTVGSSVTAASPATLFRNAVQTINRGFAEQGTRFSELDRSAQVTYLRLLAAGAADFFDLLLGMSVEGFFSGSSLAHQRAVIAWPLKSFPGAYFREAGRL